jgi:hypothetical protein
MINTAAERKNKYLMVLVSLIATALVTAASIIINHRYYAVTAYHPDPAVGLIDNSGVWQTYHTHEFFSAARQCFDPGNKSLLSSLLPLLVSPGLLLSPFSQLLWTCPLLLFFLFMLGSQILKITGNVRLSVSVILLYVGCRVLYSPYFGLSFHIVDIPAGYLLAVSAMAFLRWRDEEKAGWLYLSAVSASFAILYRYAACVYVAVVLGPMLVLWIMEKRSHVLRGKTLLPLFLAAGIFLLVCGPYVIANFRYNYAYYSYWGKSTHGTSGIGFFNSMRSVLVATGGFFGLYQVMLFLIIAFFFHSRKNTNPNGRYTLIYSLVSTFAIPLFLIAYYQSDGNKVSSAFLAFFPLIFAGVFYRNSTAIKIEKEAPVFTGLFILIVAAAILSWYKAQSSILNDDKFYQPVRRFGDSIVQGSPQSTSLVSDGMETFADALALDLQFRYNNVAARKPHPASGSVYRISRQNINAGSEMKIDSALVNDSLLYLYRAGEVKP